VRPDIVHAHSPVLVGLPAYFVAKQRRLPLVYEVRDLWENASVDRGKFADDSLPYRAARYLESWLLERADAVTTICEPLRANLAARVNAPAKIVVMPNGVEAEAFQAVPGDAALRRQLGLPEGPLAAYIGAFQPYEGLNILIDAMRAIAQVRPDAHLVI